MICFAQSLNLLLTPWSEVLVDKIVRHERVNKFLAYKNPKCHYRVHKSPPLLPIRGEMNAVHSLLCFYNIEFNNTVFVVVDLNTAVPTCMSILNDS